MSQSPRKCKPNGRAWPARAALWRKISATLQILRPVVQTDRIGLAATRAARSRPRGLAGGGGGGGGGYSGGGGADNFGGGGGGSYAAASISGEVSADGENGDNDRFTPANGEVTIAARRSTIPGAPVTYTLTTTTSYDIVAFGAQGGGTAGGVGGYGAEIGGDFTLYAGTVLGIVVGGAGGTALDHGAGGGGGSFVWIVSAPIVPEPSTWAMMLLGFAGSASWGIGGGERG